MERSDAPVLDDGKPGANVKVLLASNLDRHLYNGRMPLALGLKKRGFEVVFTCPDGPYAQRIRTAGFRVVPWPVNRRSLNPLTELLALTRLTRVYRREQPDIVHHFTSPD